MPLHTKHEAIRASVFDALDNAIVGPRNRPQILTDRLYRLMMVRIHFSTFHVSEFRGDLQELTVLLQTNVM